MKTITEILNETVKEDINQMILEEIELVDVRYTSARDILDVIEEDIKAIVAGYDLEMSKDIEKSIDNFILSCVIDKINEQLSEAIDRENEGRSNKELLAREYLL